jgi:hypothetical protein
VVGSAADSGEAARIAKRIAADTESPTCVESRGQAQRCFRPSGAATFFGGRKLIREGETRARVSSVFKREERQRRAQRRADAIFRREELDKEIDRQERAAATFFGGGARARPRENLFTRAEVTRRRLRDTALDKELDRQERAERAERRQRPGTPKRLSVWGHTKQPTRCRGPRTIASEWHTGQGSALYAFTSTGTVKRGLQREINLAMKQARSTRDRNDLRCLRSAVNEAIRSGGARGKRR